jgi:hypothetical protein
MVSINKLKCVLLVGILFFVFLKPVFAVHASPIPEDKENPEYQAFIRNFPDVDVIIEKITSGKIRDAASIPAILRVSFDGIPEYATFLSGRHTYPAGGICPTSIFQEDIFEQEAHLLSKYDFPIAKFNFATFLIGPVNNGKTDVSRKIGEIARQLQVLKTICRVLQNSKMEMEEETDEYSFAKFEKRNRYLNRLCEARQEAIKYLEIYVQLSRWERVSNDYLRSEAIKDVPAKEIGKIEEDIQKIGEYKKLEGQQIKGLLEPFVNDGFFPNLYCGLFAEPITFNFERDANEFLLELFCRQWGKEAEDALIFNILQNLEKYGRIPEVIEIYGNKDPCFQCQVKLQWLADNLTKMIVQTRAEYGLPALTHEPGKKLTIKYYAKEEYQGPCLHVGMGEIGSRKLTTRKVSDIGQIMKFEFIEGDTESQPISVYAPFSTGPS